MATPSDNRAHLPSERDFDPWGGDLDAQYAWKNFGSLTIEQAIERFRERPDIHQEDFMFMGPRAFVYYFPVLESFLLSVTAQNEVEEDYQAFILAHCIRNQFGANADEDVWRLAPRVLALSQHVRQNISRFASTAKEQSRIVKVWLQLERHLSSPPNAS